MKIIQSFWTGNKNSLTDSYGWLLPIFNYLSWIISCNQLRRYYDDVTLVTDSQGYDVLINKLHLPYTDVIVSLDCLNHYNPNLWALAKIKAYQSIKEPFIHVDGDVFIWTKIIIILLLWKFFQCFSVTLPAWITASFASCSV